jgi:hypothetical protein
MQTIISIQTTYDDENYIIIYPEDLNNLHVEKIDDGTPEKIDEIKKDFLKNFKNPEDYTILPMIELQTIEDEASYLTLLFPQIDDVLDMNYVIHKIKAKLEEIEVKRKDLIKLKQTLTNQHLITIDKYL